MNVIKVFVTAMACVVAFVISGRALAASPAEAERLFREGRAAMNDENYETARSYFQQSYEIDRALGTLLNLAVCEEKLGKLGAALAHLQKALELADAEDTRRPLIVQRISRLDARIPRLTIQPDRSIDATVTLLLDSKPLDSADLRRSIRVDPGTHVLECSGPRGERCTKIFELSEGKESVQSPTLSPLPEPPVPASPSPEAPPRPGNESPAIPPATPLPPRHGEREALAYAVGGFSLAIIVAGLIAGGGVVRQKAIVAEHCQDKACDEEGVAAAETGRTLSTISTVTTILGATGIGVSAYVLLTTPTAGTSSGATLSVTGSF
jgi:hypothetical protein